MMDHFNDNERRNPPELEVDSAIAFITRRKSPSAITPVLFAHTDAPCQPRKQMISVKDELPRYSGLPAELGGSRKALAN